MSNLAIKINLTRIPGAIYTKLTGRSGTQKNCIIIPVEDANLFIGEKGVYLDAVAIQYREQKYADSHFIKMSVPKEVFDSMSEEQRNAIPIIGGIKTIAKQEIEPTEAPEFAPPEDESGLPF